MNSPALSLISCHVCPRDCGVDRSNTTGFCGAGEAIRINLAQLHYGEEPCISGTRGSGTIFFSHCNLKCVFCQNHLISVAGHGTDHSPEQCAELMLGLQSRNAHNINLVTPSHYSPQLIESVRIARIRGLKIPILWNSNAYEHEAVLRELEGTVDIYLPDLKYAYGVHAGKYSHAQDYPAVAIRAIKEMKRQQPDPVFDQEGIMLKGMIIRLLVLPHDLAGIARSLDVLADTVGTNVWLSLMAQYYPTHLAQNYPEIARGITQEEYAKAVEAVQSRGFENVFIQELSCSDDWTPNFQTDPESSQMEKCL